MIKKEFPLGTNIVEEVSNILLSDLGGQDFSEALLIFPHKRPKFFLEKNLSQKLKKPFYSPTYFDMDLFVQNLLGIDSFAKEMDLYAILFSIFERDKNFSKFYKEKPLFALEWAIEFLDNYDKVQMELIDYKRLKRNILPEDTTFFEYFPELFKEFEEKLKKENLITRGMAYNLSSKKGNFEKLKSFKKIYFVVPPGLTKSEKEILKKMKNFDNLELILEGFTLDSEINIEIKEKEVPENFKVFKFSSDHLQLAFLREKLEKIKDEESVAIVLSKSKNLLPLLEIVLNNFPDKEFNISLGYPVYFSNIFKFLEDIFDLQADKLQEKYNSKKLIEFLSNPLLYNLFDEGFAFRAKIQKLEKNFIENSIYYISIYELIEIFKNNYKEFINFLNFAIENFFTPFENILNLGDLNEKIYNILNILSSNKFIKSNPLSEEFFETIYEFIFEIRDSKISNFSFSKVEDLFEIYLSMLKGNKIIFKGHPLRGWQVLGFLETRTLSFDNVFILNLNEGVLPSIDVYNPVIPIAAKKILGLPGPEEEEKIYRHHFLHLLNSSKNCHLYYIENEEEDTRSRFLEQILWQKEKKEKKLFEVEAGKKFNINIKKREELIIQKSKEILDFLKKKVYSPSAIDNYLSCPLKFYFENLLGLKEKEELEEEPDALRVGTIIHEFLKTLLKPYKGKELNEKILQKIKDEFKDSMDEVLNKKFLKENIQKKIFKELLIYRTSKLLEDEKVFPKGIKIKELEVYIDDIDFNGIKLKGRLDRIDELQKGVLRVVDYKTGKRNVFISKSKFEEPDSFEEFQELVNSFQVPIYYIILKKHYNIGDDKAEVLFYYFRENDSYKHYPNNEKEIGHIKDYCEKFLEKFLNIILDDKQPFQAKPKEEKYCPDCSIYYTCKG
ncbi:MAG: PD-(D/E)XK nuclease family protein [Thermoanaerobaculia bacterium]